MILDFFGNIIDVGDTVAFPASGSFMLGVIEKTRPSKRYVFADNGYEVFVRNETGHKKWKSNVDVILKTKADTI